MASPLVESANDFSQKRQIDPGFNMKNYMPVFRGNPVGGSQGMGSVNDFYKPPMNRFDPSPNGFMYKKLQAGGNENRMTVSGPPSGGYQPPNPSGGMPQPGTYPGGNTGVVGPHIGSGGYGYGGFSNPNGNVSTQPPPPSVGQQFGSGPTMSNYGGDPNRMIYVGGNPPYSGGYSNGSSPNGPLFDAAGNYNPSPSAYAGAPSPDQSFRYYGQPGNMPNLPYTGPVVAASDRTGVKPTMAPNLNDQYNQLMGMLPGQQNSPTYNAQHTLDVSDPAMNAAIAKKQGMTLSDFGIPDSVLESMKVKSAQQIGSAYDQQKEQAKRLMAKAGLLNDPASIKADTELDQARLGETFKNYTDMDTASALERNKQYQQNLNDLVSAGLNRQNAGANIFKGDEQARQFERAFGLDRYREAAKTQEQFENENMNRNALLQSVAKWLEAYDLDRAKFQSGLLDKGVQISQQEGEDLRNVVNSYPSVYNQR